jgi:phytoene synthase
MAPLPPPEALAPAYAHCDQLVRDGDKDRWLAALFAPAEYRGDLLALAAFNLEIASVRDRVSEPLPGEVRLQWWRDVLTGEGRGDVSSHPVAAAVLDVVGRRNLPIKPLMDLIEARVFDLYDDPMPSVADLEGYGGETSGALMQMGALVLAGGDDPRTGELAGHAGMAYALTGLLRSLGLHASRGQVFIPAEMLAAEGIARDDVVAGRSSTAILRVRDAMVAMATRHAAAAETLARTADRRTVAAFVPLATVMPRLKRLGAVDNPFVPPPDVSQWRLQWAMWRFARRFGRA